MAWLLDSVGRCAGSDQRLFSKIPVGTHSLDQAVVLFGRPDSVTGFFRAQRGVDSEVEDSFTIILQYTGAQKDLLVTVKTCIATPMEQQLKYLVRGTDGSFIKASFCSLLGIIGTLTRTTVPTEKHLSPGGTYCLRNETSGSRICGRNGINAWDSI